MNLLHDLSIGNPPDEVNVFIEISKGSKNKYEIDKETGLIFLDRVLYGSHVYPFDYGFLPQTHWPDGDPLDALVFSTVSFPPGVVVPSRPVAVMHMIDSGDKDEKLLCVPVDDPRFAEYRDLPDIPQHVIKELTDFYENYKKLQGKKTEITGVEGVGAARAAVQEGIALYRKEFGK